MGCARGTGRSTRIAALAFAVATLGCAATQRIALDCVPTEVTVYVDGRELEQTPKSLDLRSDRPHTLFFKGGAYPSQMIVLESAEVEGESRLSPTDVCTETSFVGMNPEVQMEVESGVSTAPPP